MYQASAMPDPGGIGSGIKESSETYESRTSQDHRRQEISVASVTHLAMVDEALAYAAHGTPVFPLKPRSKVPATPHGFKDATLDERRIRAWWRKWPDANIGLPTGEASRIAVLDIDFRHDGFTALDRLEREHGALPETLTARTGGGGQHRLFWYPAGVKVPNAAGLPGYPGLDVRGEGGYIVAPPSLHESGQRYAWIDSDVPRAEMPDWLLELLVRPPARPRAAGEMIRTSTDGETADYWLERYLADAYPGNRNAKGFGLACQLRDAGLGESAARDVMLDFAAAAPGDGYTEREALASLKSAYKGTQREPARSQTAKASRPLRALPPVPPAHGGSDDVAEPPSAGIHNLTEMGNAERLVDRHGSKILYCYDWRAWLVWDGQRWAPDNAGRIAQLAKQTARSIYGEAEAEEDDKRRAEIVKHAMRSESSRAMVGMLTWAQSERPVTPAALDNAETDWLLNCTNGVLDLRTGTLAKHNPALHITRLAPVAYDPEAKCPTWRAFLERVMAKDQELVTFLQRAIGYTLTGSTNEQVLFLPWGKGQNGKSTLLDTLSAVLGDYATQAAPATFMAKHYEGIPNDLAALKGSRFVAAVETEDGQRLAESLVKQATGGDRITARFMRGEFFSFTPNFKLWLATNHKPVIKGTDNAIWRRIRLIPFTVQIPEGERDRNLKRKLMAEAPGILAWAVRGCLDWQQDGLTLPEAVKTATEAYREEMDMLANFLEDCCETGKPYEVYSKPLYEAYEAWCEDSGERPMTKRMLGKQLRERGIGEARGTGNMPLWKDIRLKVRPTDDSYQSYRSYQKNEIEDIAPLREAATSNFGNLGNLSNQKCLPADDRPKDVCYACRTMHWTRRESGEWICETCHPRVKASPKSKRLQFDAMEVYDQDS